MSHPYQREVAVFEATLQLPPEQREAFLEQTCAGDLDLLQRIRALLKVTDGQTDFLAPAAPLPETTVVDSTPPSEKPGDRIGPYKLLQQIGEGGCGVVYMAAQEHPVRRRVALKITKLGMDTRQVIARFEAERQALALMDHPNIAKVHDAGATETGRPYFVMELVRGVKITDYCDDKKLPTQQRLELFIQVCQAVQHAHQKGIIHRDLKPSNILVTVNDGQAVTKVIDFGIAKAISGERLTDKTLFTAFEQFIGTPAYMSPEQAEITSVDIDTRTDIYSLGVLLYELLTGQTPFDAKELLQSGLEEMRRTLREKEPARPSTRLRALGAAELTTAAQRRGLEPPKLVGILRGDLDWIVMKCLEKDRARRYETTNGLAMDLRRYLNSEPVIARPPSKVYRLKKLVHRNKFAFAAMSAVGAALVLGVIGTTVGLARAEKQRRIAESSQRLERENFAQARGAVGDLLAVSDDDLHELPGMQPLRVKLLRAAIERYKPFVDRPSDDPAPRAELARIYVKYAFVAAQDGADYDKVAVPAFKAAFTIQQQLVREHPENRAISADLGWTYIFSAWKGSLNPEAQQADEQAVAIFEGLVNSAPTDPLARADLAWALHQSTWNPAAPKRRPYSQRALAIREQLVKEFPKSAEFRRDLANSLALCSYDLQDHTNALAMLSRATSLREATVADIEQRLPTIWEPSRQGYSEALLVRPNLIWTKRDLARGCEAAARRYCQLKLWPEALAQSDRASRTYRQLVDQNPSMRQLIEESVIDFETAAALAGRAGDLEAALARRREAVNYWRRLLPADDPELAVSLAFLTHALLANGKFIEAETTSWECLSIFEAKLPKDWKTANACVLRGASLLGLQRYKEAEPLLRSGFENLNQRQQQIPTGFKYFLQEAQQHLVQHYESTGQTEKAVELKKNDATPLPKSSP